jgi:hypothetical protein
MFCAHYDSVSWGPGAADNGSGVAAMLETCRAIKAGPPLMNDIILLFTDGEEQGLLGAQAFLRDHPRAKEVGLMLNFEARGTRGLSYLFETSSKNGWLIPHIVKAAPYPFMSSMMVAVYSQMPTSSDYRIFKKDIPGMNVGFIDNLPYYHTPNDNPANLSRSSLQHHGSYALAFAKYFGNMDLSAVPAESSAIYFNIFGSCIVMYPRALSLPLAIAAAILFLLVGAAGFFRRRLTIKSILGAAAIIVLTAVSVALAAALCLLFAYSCRNVYLLYNAPWYIAATCFITLAIIALSHGSSRAKIPPDALAFSAAAFWLGGLFALDSYVVGATYITLWPLLFAILGLGWSFIKPESKLTTPILAAAAIPGILIIVPLISDFFSGVTVACAPAILLFPVFLCALLAKQIHLILPRGKGLAALMAFAGIVLLGIGIAEGGFSANQPKMDCLSYAFNADTGKTLWLSTDKKTDEFTSAFFPQGTKRESVSEFGYRDFCLTAPAPDAALPAPEIQIVSDVVRDGKRSLALHIVSQRKAPRIDVRCMNPVDNVIINGQATGKRAGEFTIRYLILPRQGFDLTLETTATDPVKLTLIDFTYALPDVPNGPLFPPHIISEPNTINFDRAFQSNTTMVRKSFTL